MSQILVTGATGELGRLTLDFLLDRLPAADIAALARDPSKLDDYAGRGIDVRRGDYFDRASLERAFAGVERLMFISTVTFTDGLTQHRNVVAAAKAAGVRHIIYTAIQRRAGSGFRMSQVTELNDETEAALLASGAETTILRNAIYLEALPFMLGNDALNGIRVPTSNTAAAFVSRRDLAEANAAVLSSNGHEGRTYVLSGGVAVTMSDIAAILSGVAGRDVRFENVPVAEFVQERTRGGLPEPVAAFLAEWFQAIAAGDFAEVSGDLEHLIGRKPAKPDQVLRSLFCSS